MTRPDMAAPTDAAGQRRPDIGALLFSTITILFGIGFLAWTFIRFREGQWVDGVWVYVLGDHWGYDIEAYAGAAARLIATGSLYARELIDAPFTPGGYGYFYYAPPFGVALTPLAEMSQHDSSALWYIGKVVTLLAACLLMPVKLPIRALTFLAVALSFWAMRDLVLGNVGLLLLLFLVLGWRWLDRPLGSIATAVAISIRPSLGALLIWQLLRRRWRVAAWTIAAGAALIVLSIPFVGISGYIDYLTVLGNLEVPGAGSENRDLGSTFVLMGLDERWIGMVRFGSLILGLTLIGLSLRRDRELGYMITLAASMLLISQMWEFYLITLALPLALLADRWRPVVLLLLVASWLPSVFAPIMLFVTIGLLFLPIARLRSLTSRPRDRRADHEPAASMA